MEQQSRPPHEVDDVRPLRVMPWWLVLGGLLVAVVLGSVMLWWLLGEADQGTTRAQLRIDAIRTGLTVVAGTGGAVALLLAARRQWLSERAQRHQERRDAADHAHQQRVQEHNEQVAQAEQRHRERLAAVTEYDAIERRVTELFAKAVDHLGNDHAAVRLGGLYSLARLAHNNEAYRQTIVDVICAYLRMPGRSDEADAGEEHVRLEAQRLLFRRMRPGDGHWPDIRIDLSNTTLTDVDAQGCVFADVSFARSTFSGPANFDEAVFTEPASFAEATFTAEASLRSARWRHRAVFDGARFHGGCRFDATDFEGGASYASAKFFGEATFRSVTFRNSSVFDHAVFGGSVSFRTAVFESNASLEHVEFKAAASFKDTDFADMAMFRRSWFGGAASFEGTSFHGYAGFDRAAFANGLTFEPREHGPKSFVHTRVALKTPCFWPDGWSETRIDDDWAGVSPA